MLDVGQGFINSSTLRKIGVCKYKVTYNKVHTDYNMNSFFCDISVCTSGFCSALDIYYANALATYYTHIEMYKDEKTNQ